MPQVHSLRSGILDTSSLYAPWLFSIYSKILLSWLPPLKKSQEKLSLSPEDRASIAQMLIQSLESSQSYEKEWLETVEKRHQEINSGKVKPISWDEVKSFITDEWVYH